MKRILLTLMSVILCICCLFGCQRGNKDATSVSESESNISDTHIKVERIYDRFHSEYNIEKDSTFSVMIGNSPNLVNVKRSAEDYVVYINDKSLDEFMPENELPYSCDSFYTDDLNGDGYSELCFGVSYGSGLVDSRIWIYDYVNQKIIFSLADRGEHDYLFFKRNDVLCVKEFDFDTQDVTRTGVISYNGTEGEVVWDSEIDTREDK